MHVQQKMTRIALIQQKASADVQANIERGMDSVRTAASLGARFAAFAELAFEPFYPQRPATENAGKLAQPVPGPITEAFSVLARELEMVIVLNLYEAEMRVAAFQNGYFTALVNRVGREECLEFAGESFVCDPSGKVMARAGTGTEEVLIADLDLSLCDQSHARQLFLRHRRPGIYGQWGIS